MNKRNGIKEAVFYCLKEKMLMTVLLILAIAGTIAAAILPPMILEKAIDGLSAGLEITLGLALLYFLVSALENIFETVKEVLVTEFGQRVTRRIRFLMCEKLDRLPTSYFVKTAAGTTVSRFVNDVDTLEKLFASGVISIVVDLCKVISILAVIFVKSTGLGVLMVIATPILMLFTMWVQKRMHSAQLQNRKAVGRANRHIPETISNIRTIHALGREKYMEKKYGEQIDDSFAAMEKSNFFDAVYSPIIITVSAFMVGIMMSLSAAGNQFAAFFGMSTGTVVALIAYVSKVFDPLESIGMEIQNIQSALAGVTRINEFLREEESDILADASEKAGISVSAGTVSEVKSDVEADAKAEDFHAEADAQGEKLQMAGMPKGETCAVSVKNLDFSYDRDHQVLSKLNLEVQKGEMVTLTGRTGAGKSTLFRLILGLYRPEAGEVSVLGEDPCGIPAESRRKVFGYVEQSFRPVHGTVREQISLNDPAVTDEAIREALETTGLLQVVEDMEKGLDTVYREDLFSHGQNQLLSIARAVVLKPEILLLDEITAGLDSGTEAMILDALKGALQNRTVISISHRLYEHTGGRMITIG